MASIRKRGSSYLIVVSMGYDYNGSRIKPQQKTVHPPEELTPRQVEKWLNEQAVLFERECRHTPQPVQQLTLAKYIDLWLADIAPGKLAKSTIRRDRQDIERILPALGHYKLTELRPEHFRNFYTELRKVISPDTKKPLSEYTIEGVHATLCSILSDAVEGGFLSHNPAWRTYRYAGRKCEKKIADEETAQKIIVELSGKMAGLGLTGDTVTAPVAGGDYEEALAALVMLGFGKAAADKVVKIVARENPGASVEDLVRMSLKRL